MFNKNRIQMKKLSYLIALIFISAVLWSGTLSAQDQGTYIDNASPQDSSLTESADLNLDQKTEKKSSGNIATFIGFGVVVVGAAAFVLLRKKKK
jgi:LPXTG-motif cell wall-anchored protein